jgi:sulfoxide reductase heme-binding subunit YedZ
VGTSGNLRTQITKLVKWNNRTKVLILKAVIHIAALLPLINLYYLALNDELGGDPVEYVIHFTGIGAFNLLLLTLLISPAAKRFRLGFIMQTRRLMGLYAFGYAVFHVINFLAFDLQFAWSLFFTEILERPYISIGMLAFALLFTLALTSLNSIKSSMGRHWQSLHNSSYLIILLVAIHFYWSVKSEITSPLFYLFLSSFVLIIRYKKLKHLISTLFYRK